jgi:hypothetical protein
VVAVGASLGPVVGFAVGVPSLVSVGSGWGAVVVGSPLELALGVVAGPVAGVVGAELGALVTVFVALPVSAVEVVGPELGAAAAVESAGSTAVMAVSSFPPSPEAQPGAPRPPPKTRASNSSGLALKFVQPEVGSIKGRRELMGIEPSVWRATPAATIAVILRLT